MTLPNHLAGGLVFTGVFGAFTGVNILQSPGLIAMTLAASTLADIDVPASLWGRTFKPLSKAINRRFGHRTLTHSLLFMALLWGAVAGAMEVIGSEAPYPTVFLLAYSSHLIFDMMTVQGVPLFYPYNRSPCVIPSDPKLRLRANNPRSEIAVFGFFVLSGIFLQPLMADGFWTSYNRLFGTMAHLHSEFEKAEDVLNVSYRYREASNEYTGSGLAVECTGTITDLWHPTTGWERLDASPTSSRTILEVLPEHTGRTFTFDRRSFVAISADSLDRLVRSGNLYQIQLSANEPFTVSYATALNREQTTVRSLDLELVEKLSVFELPGESSSTTVRYHHTPRIKTLEAKIKDLRSRQAEEQAAAQNLQQRIETLILIRDTATDLYEEQRATEELTKLRKQVKEVSDITSEVRQLQVQIDELRAQDRIKYDDKVTDLKRQERKNQSPTLELTGIATFVSFTDPAHQKKQTKLNLK